MSSRRHSPGMSFLVRSAVIVLVAELVAFAYAKGSAASKSQWQTLDGSAPLVVARGGFSGLFPDSSAGAYSFAVSTSVSNVILWCDVQLTKDGDGVCFPYLNLDNGSDISVAMKAKKSVYDVNGVSSEGYFTIDYTSEDLTTKVSLNQGIYSRNPGFDGLFPLMSVVGVFKNAKPPGFWLNIQHDAFFSQHKLSMRSFVLGASKKAIINYISSPEVKFLQGIAKPFAPTKTKLIFRFLSQDETDPSTNQTYGSLLKNLTFIKTFASGILVPKSYIWPVDGSLYLQPHTSIVTDAHQIGLQVFAADFANDFLFAYNYSYNPITEYLSFIDNGEFAVDGVLSDFPITPSEAIECFAHMDKNATGQATPLVISHNGASGDYPRCTDIAYAKAIADGANVIDCNVQMSKDNVPFCLASMNLYDSTNAAQTAFSTLAKTVPELQKNPGVFSFSLTWSQIQGLTPVISNPFPTYLLYRNPKFKNAGKLVSLSDFLALAQNASSLSGVMIGIENAFYLAENEGISVTDAVMEALNKAGYSGNSTKKVMIQSKDSSVLAKFKGKNYERVYLVDDQIRDIEDSTISEIKNFSDSVVIQKASQYPEEGGFVIGVNRITEKLQSFKLKVYAKVFANEFVSIDYDFFSDPIVEINQFVTDANVDGIITDFPQTAASYKKNRCLNSKNAPAFTAPVVAGDLVQYLAPGAAPPAQPPAPVLTDANVTEAALPPAADIALPPAPAPAASTPKTPSSGPRITSVAFSTWLVIAAAALLLF